MAERKSKKELTFEQGLEQLEAITGQLEKNELPLEELMRLYEEGMKLSESLSQKLNAAQSKLQILTADSEGNPVVTGEMLPEGGNADGL